MREHYAGKKLIVARDKFDLLSIKNKSKLACCGTEVLSHAVRLTGIDVSVERITIGG